MPHAVTDPRRRLALQIAIQLPENVAEARQVLALAGDVLDDFLIDGISDAQRRARRLGWGLALPDPPADARPPPAPASPGAQRAWAAIWSFASLLTSFPIAALLVAQFGAGAGMTFALQITVIALVFGVRPALALAVLIPPLHNLVVVPPMIEFTFPAVAEVLAAVSYLLLATVVPWIAARRGKIRSVAIRPIPMRPQRPDIKAVRSA